jgi:hypothetical protein
VTRVITPQRNKWRGNTAREVHIYWGFTTGFTTEEEAARVGGPGAMTGPSSNPKGT